MNGADGETRAYPAPGSDEERAAYAQLQAGLAAHPLDEVRAVIGRAAGLGGDRAHLQAAPAGDLVGADLERAQGPLHGGLAEPAGLRQALA